MAAQFKQFTAYILAISAIIQSMTQICINMAWSNISYMSLWSPILATHCQRDNPRSETPQTYSIQCIYHTDYLLAQNKICSKYYCLCTDKISYNIENHNTLLFCTCNIKLQIKIQGTVQHD